MSRAVGITVACVAALFLCVAVLRHVQAPRTELLQGPDFVAERRAALQQLSARPGSPQMLAAEKSAYAQGYKQGQQEELRVTEAPALLRAADKWRTTMLARLRAQEQEEKTLDARREVHAEQRVAKAMTAAMRAEEASEPKAYAEWKSMGAGGQEKFAAKRMQLAMEEAGKKEPAAYRRMQLALKAEEKAEPRAYEAWKSMGGSGQEAQAAKKMSLAYMAEEKAEPRAYEAWKSMGGGGQEAQAAKKMSLAYRAEESLEPMAYERFENARQERARRAMAESRLEALHRAAAREAAAAQPAQQLSEVGEEKVALGEAQRLFKFCEEHFPGAVGLRKFCFEKLASPPHRGDALAAPAGSKPPAVSEEQFTGPSLAAAIERAHAAGLGGMPKYAVYHSPDGREEAFRLVRVPNGGEVPRDAVGFVNMPDEPRTQLTQEGAGAARREGGGAVKVDAPSLAGAIREAHAMGLKGEPKYVVFHPAHGEPEVFKLAGRE